MLRAFIIAALSFASPLAASNVTLVHFTDYHSHALPFFSEDREQQGGIARAIAYLEREKSRGAFVFSGGDMINIGAPAWSDKFGCIEWSWLNGIVDAMAYGNHDADYGAAVFKACRAQLRYPILGANVVDAEGERLFDVGGKPYIVLERAGRRIGVFATAGSDFEKLVRSDRRPAVGARFIDRTEAARAVVEALRERERVDAVVMIGHGQREDDESLARAVNGIDLIFGTHGHLKVQLSKIDGTSTYYIAPYQYLTYVSRVEIEFDNDGGVKRISGGLVPMDDALPEDEEVKLRVGAMQRELERDPAYAELFATVGTVPRAFSLAGQYEEQTTLGRFVMNIVRDAAGADLALSTTSSFRRAIAPGALRFEELRATLPYPNRVLVFELTPEELWELRQLSESKRGTDSFAQWSDVRKKRRSARIRVATTDYLARVAEGYAQFFAARKAIETPHEVRELVRRYIETHW